MRTVPASSQDNLNYNTGGSTGQNEWINNVSFGTWPATFGTASGNSTNRFSLYVTYSVSGGGGDTTPPTVPAGLAVTGVTTSTVTISWTASTDNVGVAGYKVFRNGTQVGTTAGTGYTDTGLTPATSYTYTVSAYDAAGNNSAQSSGVQERRKRPAMPSLPSPQFLLLPTTVRPQARSRLPPQPPIMWASRASNLRGRRALGHRHGVSLCVHLEHGVLCECRPCSANQGL